jgi:hypothetical protein
MSQDSIKYSLSSVLGQYDALEFCFDANDSIVDGTGSGSFWTGYLSNISPAQGKEDNIALVLQGTGSSKAQAISNTNNFIDSNGLSLIDSNLKIPLNDIDLSNSSFIVDFEITGNVESGILFGAFEKEELQLPDTSFITGSKGYNFGITDRGHFFLQGFSADGGFVKVFNEIELAQRNVVSFAHLDGFIEIGFFDFFNDEVVSFHKNLNSFYCQSPQDLFIGGTNQTFEATDAESSTFLGYIKSIYGFNESLNNKNLYDLNTGFISDYYFNSGGQTLVEQPYLSGQIITYKTGITGYDCVADTGSEIIDYFNITGGSTFTGSFNIDEGSSYAFLQGGDLIEGKFLSDLYSGQYNPTGQNAFDTLGLENYTGNVSGYDFGTGILENTGEYNYFTCTPLTGFLDEISGTQNIYSTTGVYVNLPDVSGIQFNLESEKFKMEYIYYMGDRS